MSGETISLAKAAELIETGEWVIGSHVRNKIEAYAQPVLSTLAANPATANIDKSVFLRSRNGRLCESFGDGALPFRELQGVGEGAHGVGVEALPLAVLDHAYSLGR